MEYLLGFIFLLLFWSFKPEAKKDPPKSNSQQLSEALDKMLDEKIDKLAEKLKPADQEEKEDKK
jgi:hypothetical protein